MALSTVTADTAVAMIKDKWVLETDLALNLWSYFDQRKFMGPLKEWAELALSRMAYFGKSHPLLTEAVAKEEKYLQVYAKSGTLERLINNRATTLLTPSDISDVIRLYGAWIEQGSARGLDDRIKAEAAEKKLRRKQNPLIAAGAGRDAWGPEERDRGDMIRDFNFHRAHQPATKYAQKQREWLQQRFPYAKNVSVEFAPGGAPLFKDQTHGVMAGRRKNPAGRSTVGRVERAFGLLDLDSKTEGADISGTTADHIYFIDRCVTSQYGTQHLAINKHTSGRPADAIFYMLPLATLVGHYHHALVETALALTFRNIVKYIISDYDTLAPEASSFKQEVKRILNQSKQNVKNKRILVWWKEPWRPGGAYVFGEDGRWGNVANVSRAHARAATFHDWPTQSDINRYILEASM